jgi:hypothetical protein
MLVPQNLSAPRQANTGLFDQPRVSRELASRYIHSLFYSLGSNDYKPFRFMIISATF